MRARLHLAAYIVHVRVPFHLSPVEHLFGPQSCCRTVILPLYSSSGDGSAGFPALGRQNKLAQDMRDFVANGNVLVVVGGTMAKLFLNRYFSLHIAEADGGYSRGPWFRSLPARVPSGSSQVRMCAGGSGASCPCREPMAMVRVKGGDRMHKATRRRGVWSVLYHCPSRAWHVHPGDNSH